MASIGSRIKAGATALLRAAKRTFTGRGAKGKGGGAKGGGGKAGRGGG